MGLGDIQTQDTIDIQNTDRRKIRQSGEECHTKRKFIKYTHGETTLLEMS